MHEMIIFFSHSLLYKAVFHGSFFYTLIMNHFVSILITYLQLGMRPVKVIFLIELGQIHSIAGFHNPVNRLDAFSYSSGWQEWHMLSAGFHASRYWPGCDRKKLKRRMNLKFKMIWTEEASFSVFFILQPFSGSPFHFLSLYFCMYLL